jgi:hypothetical protein
MPVVLPLGLDNARCSEAVARGADGSLVRQPEAGGSLVVGVVLRAV